MKEVLCFIYDGFVDYETVLTCSVLNSNSYKVTYIAYDGEEIYSLSGLKVKPEKNTSDITDFKDIEGLIIPGGHNRICKPELIRLINQINEEKKLVAAICAGPEFLAKSGILNGKKYTTSALPESYEEKKEKDPFPRETYLKTRVIQDGNIITAQGFAFVDFAIKIWEWYNLFDDEEEKAEVWKQYTEN
ncbi:MAG: DJ-1/PfpI family protein [Candidatus Heimdallarchaeota archaeon]